MSVKSFFDDYARGFDDIYDETGGIINRYLRRSLYDRFEYVIGAAEGLPDGFSLLDVGCGSGRYVDTLAERAGEMVGVDFAQKMLDILADNAEKGGYAQKVTTVCGDFLETEINDDFDLVLAVGYFDYIRDAKEHLSAMVELTKGDLIASFPKRWHILTPQRKVRYLLAGCPIYFYAEWDVYDLFGYKYLDKLQLLDFGRDYIAHLSLR
jgi:predicted TPR repeat methyltransferase